MLSAVISLLSDTNWSAARPVGELAQPPLISAGISAILCSSGGGNEPHTQSLNSLIMRKIESEMIAAIKNNQDWKSANTEVVSQQDGVSIVYLYGNKIAEIGDDFLRLYDGDEQTKTTKSRLNAILGEFGYTCGTKREYVFQKQFEWFVNYFNMKSNQIEVVPFVDGMVLCG